MNNDSFPVVFSPDNEPYLGRKLLYHFDELICSTMEQNFQTAPQSFSQKLTDQQKMACQVIPQSISIMLSIRELIRQGYLFGAHVLLRSFVERVTILLYINYYPQEIERWNRGWHFKDAPSLSKMFEAIQKKQENNPVIEGWKLTEEMNNLVHGKPDSAYWNLINTSEDKVGHAVSKLLERPDLCDELCADIIPSIAILQSMMATYFPRK